MSNSTDTEEEVEVTFDTDSCVNWSNTMVNKLSEAVCSQLQGTDFWRPYYDVEIDWDKIAKEVGCQPEKCRLKWMSLLKTVRTYRTIHEIIQDIHTQHSKLAIKKMNGDIMARQKAPTSPQVKNELTFIRKKKGNPDHPKKPINSGYVLFCQKLGSQQEEIGIKKFLKLSQMWKSLSADEKQRYDDKVSKLKQEYHFSVTKYSENHPDDEEINHILSELNSRKNSTKRSRLTRAFEFSDTISDADIDTDNEKPPPSGTVRCETTNKKMKFSHPKTAESVYVERKLGDNLKSHPKYDEDYCVEKLKRKFQRLSDVKQAKYEAQVEDTN